MKDIFKTIAQGISVLFFLVPPLLWLELTIDQTNWPKSIFFISLSLVLVVIFAFDLLVNRRGLKLVRTPFSLPLICLAAAFLVSLAFSPNRVEAAVLPTGAAPMAALIVTYLVLTGPLWQENRWALKVGGLAFVVGAVLAGAITFISFLPGAAFPFRPFVTTGPLLALIPYLAICFSGSLAYFIFSLIKHRREGPGEIVVVATAGVLAAAILAGIVWQIWSTREQFFVSLPYWVGWQVAAESLKVSPVWGRGPTDFLTAFTVGRPIALNADPLLWNFRFFVSSNYPLHLAATTGLLGVVAYGYLIIEISKILLGQFRKLSSLGWGLAAMLAATVVIQFLLPPTLIGWWTLLATLTLFTLYLRSVRSELVETKEPAEALTNLTETPIAEGLARPKAKTILSIAIAVILILLVIPTAYFTWRVSAAEVIYKQGVDAAVANKGRESLNLISQAIILNPWIDTYHAGSSQLQLAMANLLASKGKDFSDEDRKTAVEYIQGAIAEGKRATEIGPLKVTNWENLAGLYRNLFNLVTGADRFSLAALSSAAILDPTNPNLKLNQGGTYYTLGDFDSAVGFFGQAVNLKPDWANAHYNLSAALRERKDYKNAIEEMQKALALVPAGSDDHAKASAELEGLKQASISGRLTTSLTVTPESTAAAGRPMAPKTLEQPSPVPTPAIKPPLKISSESGVPAGPSPSPSTKQ